VNFLFALLGVLGYSIMLSMVIFPSDGKNSKEVVIQPFKKDEAVLNDARFVAIYPYRALDYNGNDLKYCISNNGKNIILPDTMKTITPAGSIGTGAPIPGFIASIPGKRSVLR